METQRSPSNDVLLAAVDLGPVAGHVLAGAAVLARMLDAPLHVRHVSERAAPGAAASERVNALVRRDEEALHTLLRRAAPKLSAASSGVRTGRAAEVIACDAHQLGATMIVLGPHTGSELGARMFGTTADRIVRTARIPCLVVRAPLEWPLPAIAVATDFSAAAKEALCVAARLAAAARARGAAPALHLLHVAQPLVDDAAAQEHERDILGKQLAGLETKLKAGSDVAVHSEVVFAPNVSETIADWAARHPGTLLVMGTVGAGAPRRLLLGGVAGRVARDAAAPVLLVPLPASRPRSIAHETPRLECVVSGVDFGAESIAAAEWTGAVFAAGARQLLVHAVEVPDNAAFLGEPGLHERLGIELHAQEAERLGALFPDVDAAMRIVLDGRPADVLAAVAREQAADLVTIGGPSRHRPWDLLGSTADQLIRCSPVPVLVVRGRPVGPPRRILASVDASARSIDVLRRAGWLAARYGAEVHVAHVLSPRYVGAARMVSGMLAARELEDAYEAQTLTWLRRLVETAHLDAAACRLWVRTGDPAWELLALQQRIDADLVVIGSRGAGFVGRALAGSVSHAVLRGATCSVLLVRNGED